MSDCGDTTTPAFVRFQVFDVDVRDTFGDIDDDDQSGRGQCKVVVYGRTLDGTGVLLVVRGFRPWFLVGLSPGPPHPKHVDLERIGRDIILDVYKLDRGGYLSSAEDGFQRRKYSAQYHPLSTVVWRKHLMGWRGDPETQGTTTQEFPWWKMSFPNGRKRYDGEKKIDKFTFHGSVCRVWGSDIATDTQFFINTDTKRFGWVQIPIRSARWIGSRMHTYDCDLEYECDISSFAPIPTGDCPDCCAPMKIMSWDLETMSVDGSFPKPNVPGNVIMNIGSTIDIAHPPPSSSNTKRDVVFCLGSLPQDAASNPENGGINFVSFDQERNMLLAWRQWAVEQYGVDIMIAYNSSIFDWQYAVGRASVLGVSKEFAHWSKLRCDVSQFIENESGGSKQAGARERSRWRRMFGIIDFDVYQYFLGAEKLRSYKLDSVAGEYLEDHKIPLTPRQMWTNFETERGRLETAVYCGKDCDLPLRLFNVRMILPQYIEMSKLTYTSIADLQHRGQQRKIVNLLSYYSEREGYVMNIEEGLSMVSPQGATVLPPKSGFYKTPVLTLDFEALYPSIMKAFGLGMSTAVLHDDQMNHQGAQYERHHIDNRNVTHTFVTHVKGLIPGILEELHDCRKQAKRDMASEKDPQRKSALNARQLALKLTANSIYGFTLAVGTNPYALTSIGETVTYNGRKMIEQTKQFVERSFPAEYFYGSEEATPAHLRGKHSEVVYGDSVPGNTPVLVDGCWCGRPRFTSVENLWQILLRDAEQTASEPSHESCGEEHHPKMYVDTSNAQPAMRVWSDVGFTKILKVMRHRTNKRLFRVTTAGAGSVTVTEDHSLLDHLGRVLKPTNITCGVTRLLICPPHPPEDTTGDPGNNVVDGGLVHPDSTIVSVVPLEKGERDAFVYDLETANHHFAAGTGRIVVHNTDSVMVHVPVEPNKDGLRLAIENGPSMGVLVNKLFRPPINLEYEKVFFPFYLSDTKKKYVGKMFVNNPDTFFVNSKGLENVRRETFMFTSELIDKIIDDAIVHGDLSRACDTIDRELERFLQPGSIPFSHFILSKSVKPLDHYKPGQMLAHIEVVKKMKKRDPGSEPRPGDRVQYVIVEGSGKIAEKAVDVAYARANNLPLDMTYYVNNCVRKAIVRFCSLFYPGIDKKFEILLECIENRRLRQVTVYDALFAGRRRQSSSSSSVNNHAHSYDADESLPVMKRRRTKESTSTKQLTFADIMHKKIE